LASIDSADEAARWAYRNLPAKNTLTAEDAQMVEERFRMKLLAMDEPAKSESDIAAAQADTPVSSPPPKVARKTVRGVTKRPHSVAVEALGKTVRLRDKEHRRFVARQPCLVCGRAPSDAHHLTFTQPRALGTRVSDEFTVPVCRIHHRALHRHGNEVAWWDKLLIDPLPTALKLWQQTHLVRGSVLADDGQSHFANESNPSPENPTGALADRDVELQNWVSKGAEPE
jgi:hypothetical protein